MKGVVCVSNPWDWVVATGYIEHGNWLNKYIYGPVLADALLTMFKNSRYAFETDKRISIKDIYSKRYVNIRFFDARVTAPLFGCESFGISVSLFLTLHSRFKDAWDYYQHASSEPWLEKIRVPHLSLHTVDDPMVAPWNMPYAKARKSGHVVMATTHAGGHVAWFTTSKAGELRRWFSTPIREFIEAIQTIDPSPRLTPSALPADAKGMIRSAEYPDRVGFLPVDGKGLMTARVYNATAHNPNLGS
jgi:predicted alpha/beta-fold hydrolase